MICLINTWIKGILFFHGKRYYLCSVYYKCVIVPHFLYLKKIYILFTQVIYYYSLIKLATKLQMLCVYNIQLIYNIYSQFSSKNILIITIIYVIIFDRGKSLLYYLLDFVVLESHIY